MNINTTLSNLLILFSIVVLGCSYFIGLFIPNHPEIFQFVSDTSFLVLIIGYVLRKKNIQQIIGLFLRLLYYNLNLFKDELFQIQNEQIFYFAWDYAFYVLIASSILLLPTLLDNYKFPPLTNKANLKDSTIIWASVLLTVLIQFSIRLMI